MKKLNTEIKKTLKYFSIFAYHPTLEEIHTFLKVKISKDELEKELKRIKYTPPQYSIIRNPKSVIKRLKNYELRITNSKKKLNSIRFQLYIKLISLFPQIRLIGLSGSISMMNAGEDDDIDLFIITAKNRLFTGRLIALVLAQILGLRRKRDSALQFFITRESHHFVVPSKVKKIIRASSPNQKLTTNYSLPTTHYADKVCLNLFFDERELKVPKFKQTEFVGHEVLQMKPVIVKGDIYERFLEANRWVFRLFPNAKSVFSMKYLVSSIKNKKKEFSIQNTRYYILDTVNDWVEERLKKFQLRLINHHRTTEIITSSQLWFHPDDFEKKLKTVENG